MYSKILILRFPGDVVHKPIVCTLVRDYDLTFNILNATVFPRKEGILVLELYGSRKISGKVSDISKNRVSMLRMQSRKSNGKKKNALIAAHAQQCAPPAPFGFSDLR